MNGLRSRDNRILVGTFSRSGGFILPIIFMQLALLLSKFNVVERGDSLKGFGLPGVILPVPKTKASNQNQ